MRDIYAGTIDTRDLIERRDELNERADENPDNLSRDERQELADINALLDQFGRGADAGIAMVPERDFEDYAREQLQQDYSSVDFRGTSYWYRE